VIGLGPRGRNVARLLRQIVAVVLAAEIAVGCGSDDPAPAATAPPAPVTLSLVTYDSFPTGDTSLNAALATFTAESGIDVRIVVAGDTGTMVTKAELTAGNPEGDVMWGVDNTFLSRALEADVFAPYESTQLAALDDELTALVPGREVTPVDFGDVCINYDVAWFAERGVAPPATLRDLAAPTYRDLLVVENPGSSSPGLAFLLATIAELGDGWQAYWKDLRANGVEVVDSWNSAYYERFSGSSGGGPRPLVVSYGTSPPAEVLFADPPRQDAPTAVVAETCFRQVEFAGVLRGTEHEREARSLVDFLAGTTFQKELALNLFVYPARNDVQLPEEFTTFSVLPDEPLTLDPAQISAHREEWVDEWTQIVLR
jgi:thiamine transport system substrate-binding protein